MTHLRSAHSALLFTLTVLVCSLAVGCAADPIDSPFQVRAGRPMLIQNGQAVTSIYCDRYARENGWHRRNADFAGRGVDTFHLTLRGDMDSDFYTTPFWIGDGEYANDESARPGDRSLLDQARPILAANPEAHFTVHFFTKPPIAFARQHPDQMQTDDNGHRYRSASFASQAWIDGQCKMIRRLVRHIDASPIADRVIGYTIIAQHEGGTDLSPEGFLFDQSEVTQQRFNQYLKNKYINNKSLRNAWNDDAADLDANNVPTMAKLDSDRAGWLSFTTPQQTQRYLDYFALMRDLMHERLGLYAQTIHDTAGRPVAVTVDAMKQPMAGWMLNDAFFAANHGMNQPDYLLAAGSYDVARTLDLPQINGLMTPADYSVRSMGYGFGPEGLSDSVVLRGKLMLIEDDARSWIDPHFSSEQGAWRNANEARVGLRRNLAVAASRGMLPHWANVSRGYFDDPQMMQIIEELVPQREKLFAAPLHHTPDAIAMILDDTSHLYTDFTSGFQQLAVLQQRNAELARTGLPFRVYLFSDLARDDMPAYKAYLFPNLLKLDENRLQLIREKILRNGNVAIFGPATGITDGQSLTAAPLSQLLGIPMQLVEKQTPRRVLVHAGVHPAVADLPAAISFGDSYAYGPILVPPLDLPAPAVELGKANLYWGINSAGLIVREFGKGAANNADPGERGPGDAAAVFSAATPIPASVLRSLALYAGVNPWSALGDVVSTDGRFLSVHSVTPGPRKITLPQPSDIFDYETDQPIAQGVTKLEIDLPSPGIRWLRVQPVPSQRPDDSP